MAKKATNRASSRYGTSRRGSVNVVACIRPAAESSPLWRGLLDGGSDRRKGYGGGHFHFAEHDAADGEHAALLRIITAAPPTRTITLSCHQTDPTQQPVRQRQHQQQTIYPIWTSDLRMTQRPTIALVLVIAEQLLHRHPLAVQIGQHHRLLAQVGHQEPRLIPLLGQVRLPADDDLLRHRIVLAVTHPGQHHRHALFHWIILKIAAIGRPFDPYVRLDANEVAETQLLTSLGQLGAAKT